MEKYLDKEAPFNILKSIVEHCTACPELVKSRSKYPWGKPTFGYGDINSPIVFVGEAPGHLGCGRTGKPFMGDRSGEIYFRALKESGLEYDKVYTTNIVKCCPLDNRTPKREEILNCSKWLKMELNIVKPKLIVCLGRTAANWFGIEESLNSAMLIDYKWEGCLVKVLYHPAYPLRCGSQAILHYINRFKLLTKNESGLF